MKSSTPMKSSKMMTKILCGRFEIRFNRELERMAAMLHKQWFALATDDLKDDIFLHV